MKTFKQYFSEAKITREQAIEKLKKTRKLTTALLEPLGISMESFLKLAQQEKGKIKEITDKLIDMLSKKESVEWTDEILPLTEKKVTGKTSVDNKHSHTYSIDDEGDGKTILTEPKTFPDQHVHEIKSAEIMKSGKKKHTHTLKTAK